MENFSFDLSPVLQAVLTLLGGGAAGAIVVKLIDYYKTRYTKTTDDLAVFRKELLAELRSLKTANNALEQELYNSRKAALDIEARYTAEISQIKQQHDMLTNEHNLLRKKYVLLLDRIKKHPALYADLKDEFFLELEDDVMEAGDTVLS